MLKMNQVLLREAYAKERLDYEQYRIFKRCQWFCDGRWKLEDRSHFCGPAIASTNEEVNKREQLVSGSSNYF